MSSNKTSLLLVMTILMLRQIVKFSVISIQLPNKGKFAKLRRCCQSLEKHMCFPRGALLDHNDGGTVQRFLPGAVQQLKLLPRVNTSLFHALQ